MWTRTTVTVDFSDHWRIKDSPWTPPSGMTLDEAVSLIVRGIGPLRVSEALIIDSPNLSRSPSPVYHNDSPVSMSRSPSLDTDSESLVSSSGGLPLLGSPFAGHRIPRDDELFDDCLAKRIIASLDDCDCVTVSPSNL